MGWYNGILAGIKEKWSGLETFFKGLWGNIGSGSKTAWNDVSGAARQGGANLVTWWQGLSTSFAKSPLGSSIIKTLQTQFAQIGPQLGQIGTQMRTQLGGAIAGIMPAIGNLGNSFTQIWGQITPAIKAVSGPLGELGKLLGGTFLSSWKLIQGALTQIWQMHVGGDCAVTEVDWIYGGSRCDRHNAITQL